MSKWVIDNTKVTNYGDTMVDMEIPSSTTPVYGTDEPGAPVALTTLNDSAEMFARIANNIRRATRRTLYEDLTITINNAADLTAANTTIAQYTQIEGGVTLKINFAATVTGDGLLFSGIGGGGAIEVDLNDKDYTVNTGSYCIKFSACSVAKVYIYGDGAASCSIKTTTSSHRVLEFDDCISNIQIALLTLDGGSAANVNLLRADYSRGIRMTTCNINATGSGSVGFYANINSDIYASVIGVTNADTVIKNYNSSRIFAEAFTFTNAPSAAYVVMDNVSLYKYYPLTTGSSKTTTTILDVKCIAGMLEYSDLDQDLTIQLPASTLDVGTSSLLFQNIKGVGTLTLRGDTLVTGLSTSQNSILQALDANDIDILKFSDVKCNIIVDSIKFNQLDDDNAVACVHFNNCTGSVVLEDSWLNHAAKLNYSIGVLVTGCQNVWLEDNYYDYGYYGIRADYNSKVFSDNNDTNSNNSEVGIYSLYNAAVGKNSNQPSGDTSNEVTLSGGVIR